MFGESFIKCSNIREIEIEHIINTNTNKLIINGAYLSEIYHLTDLVTLNEPHT